MGWKGGRMLACSDVPAGWPQFKQGASHGGHTVAGGLIGSSNASRLRLRWSSPAGRCVADGPVVAGGLVVVGAGDLGVAAFDLAGGQLRWRFDNRGISG